MAKGIYDHMYKHKIQSLNIACKPVYQVILMSYNHFSAVAIILHHWMMATIVHNVHIPMYITDVKYTHMIH